MLPGHALFPPPFPSSAAGRPAVNGVFSGAVFGPGESSNSVRTTRTEWDSFEVLSVTGLNALHGIHASYDDIESLSLFLYKQTFQSLEWSYVAAIGITVLVVLSVIAGIILARAGRRAR